MTALVRAELLKLRTTRLLVWLLVATLAMVALTAAESVPAVGSVSSGLSLHQDELLARIVAVSVGVAQVTIVLLGVIAFTQEVRYGTLTSTFLVEPRRSRVLVAKGAALVLASVAVTAATVVVASLAAAVVIRSREGEVVLAAEFWETVAASFLAMALFGIIGLAIGGALRNQVIAVVVVLLWLLLAEHLLIEALPAVERWTPGGATYGLLQLGPVIGTEGRLLDAPLGGLLLIGYTAVVAALALHLVTRRDVG